MRRLSIILIGLFMLPGPLAQAITVNKARVAKGAVEVRGRGAAAGADISWEGQVVTQANNKGEES